jgi:exopolyphosphatase/guanosine-5'-triphosphate,3'-diphosphate pyrophosphatase
LTLTLPRCAVVDLGSNSVRLVVFEGESRNPVAIFNEKAVLRLGRGLQQTGRLNEEGVHQALTVMSRYHAVARAMRANPFEVLATAAVRDAENGAEFVEGLKARMPGVPIRILSGKEEAALSAAGVLCGIPNAEGILLDIGGGSLEAVRLLAGRAIHSETMRLGVIRLADRAGGDLLRARSIVEEDTALVPWLAQGAGQDLYLVGGAFRALARIHMAQTSYPLNMLHHYTIARDEARDLAGVVAGASRRALERLPGLPRRRIDDLPFAAVVLRRLLRVTGAARVVFSANGLREGWLMDIMPPAVRGDEPVTAAARDMAMLFSRDPTSGVCAKRPAGSPTSPATTIRNTVPSRASCGCCGSQGRASTITPAPSSRSPSPCATRPSPIRPSWRRPACCSTWPPPSAPRLWAPRCSWPIRSPLARRICSPAPRSPSQTASSFSTSTRMPASSRAKA